MDTELEALYRVNDVVNAISNTCKTFVRAEDGSVFILNQEGGLEERIINKDIIECNYALENCRSGDDVPIYAFTEKFKDDLMNSVYNAVLPNHKSKMDRYHKKIALGSMPGLKCIKDKICRLLGEYKLIDKLSNTDIETFFEKHTCDNPMCVSKEFFSLDEPDIEFPKLNVSHPDWFYYLPDSKEEDEAYLKNLIPYMKLFLKEPVSRRCVLCDIYFSLTEGEDAVTILGLPEEFIINDTICNLYGRFSVDLNTCCLGSLKILRTKNDLDQECFVVHLDDKIYHGL